MIYGYLRVSSDEQDVNNQKQGVVKFAEQHEWKIEAYITDEGISGTKDPSNVRSENS
jgi:Resolvase, N terminal domain.